VIHKVIHKLGHKLGTLNKQNKTKLNNTNAATKTAADFYLKNVNPVASEFELREIQSYEDTMPSDLVIHAIEIAIEQRNATLRYIKGILNSWKAKGIVCLKQAIAESEERNKKKVFVADDDRWETVRKQLEKEGKL